MPDIAQWLTELGLEKYISDFAEAEIDLATLPDLVEDDLKELGLPLGPRRKIWAAIQRLEGASGTGKPEPSVNKDTVTASPTTYDAERRHLTVMFVDLVGSTEMASRVDPEDMRNVITGYQNTVAGVVTRYDGFVAKFMGDGVLCYFGWPRASEDDPERAVRAGLNIIDAVKKTSGPDGEPLATRVGIATGVVIVGDLIGSGATQEAAVVGETPNLAARLQGIATANQVVVPQTTADLLGKVFELNAMGSHQLKGITEAVEAYAVAGETVLESRFAGRQSDQLTPIVGREQELSLILERWAKAKAGSGQMVVISGEAGIGKSRATSAVIDEISKDDHIRLTYQCSPYHTDSAFFPVIHQLNYAAGISAADSNLERLDKLERLIGSSTEDIVLMAMLLGIDPGERYQALDLTPAQIRARTMQALINSLVRAAEQKPVLAIFEDLHWIDPTTLELMDSTLDTLADKKILVLATARPVFQHGFGGHPLVTRFALNRLDSEQILSIVLKLTGGKTLPEEVMSVIATRTDGVPLFVEELTKTILESGVFKVMEDRLVLDGPLDILTIPNSLHDSLMARLDRLQPIKEIAQTAACIGREFSYRLLASVSTLSDSELTTALEGLIEAELIYRRGLPPEASYLFKHALVRDAAYESLLKERRRATHARILIALEKQPDITPEVLAHHAENSGQTDRAIELWETASRAAIARPALDEAISHLRRAISLISPQLASGETPVLERALRLQVQLSMTLLSRIGYGADETKTAFEYALELANRIGDTPMRFSILYGLWVGKYIRAEFTKTVPQARALLKLAEQSTDTAPLVLAHRIVGVSFCMQGRFEEAQPPLDRSLTNYDPTEHAGLGNRYGQDLGVAIHCYQMLNLYSLGKTRRAEEHRSNVEQNMQAARHLNTDCYAYIHLALMSMLRNDHAGLDRSIMAMMALAREHAMELWLQYGQLFEALIASRKGERTAVADFIELDPVVCATKSILFLPQLRIETGWQALALGMYEPATHLATSALEQIERTGERYILSDCFRLLAALEFAAGDSAGAEEQLNLALNVAREQHSKLWELRAAIDLARILQANDRRAEADTLLRPICGEIAAGDCAVEINIAQSLLDN